MTDLAPGVVELPPGVAHSIYAYTRYRCRCDTCAGHKARIGRAYRDRKGITKFTKPGPKPKPQRAQPQGGTISKARELRIISRQKPELVPTFQPTPVDDCGELIAAGRWCRKPYPCPEHGGDIA
jgi:hypothetical protein